MNYFKNSGIRSTFRYFQIMAFLSMKRWLPKEIVSHILSYIVTVKCAIVLAQPNRIFDRVILGNFQVSEMYRYKRSKYISLTRKLQEIGHIVYNIELRLNDLFERQQAGGSQAGGSQVGGSRAGGSQVGESQAGGSYALEQRFSKISDSKKKDLQVISDLKDKQAQIKLNLDIARCEHDIIDLKKRKTILLMLWIRWFLKRVQLVNGHVNVNKTTPLATPLSKPRQKLSKLQYVLKYKDVNSSDKHMVLNTYKTEYTRLKKELKVVRNKNCLKNLMISYFHVLEKMYTEQTPKLYVEQVLGLQEYPELAQKYTELSVSHEEFSRELGDMKRLKGGLLLQFRTEDKPLTKRASQFESRVARKNEKIERRELRNSRKASRSSSNSSSCKSGTIAELIFAKLN